MQDPATGWKALRDFWGRWPGDRATNLEQGRCGQQGPNQERAAELGQAKDDEV